MEIYGRFKYQLRKLVIKVIIVVKQLKAELDYAGRMKITKAI